RAMSAYCASIMPVADASWTASIASARLPSAGGYDASMPMDRDMRSMRTSAPTRDHQVERTDHSLVHSEATAAVSPVPGEVWAVAEVIGAALLREWSRCGPRRCPS